MHVGETASVACCEKEREQFLRRLFHIVKTPAGNLGPPFTPHSALRNPQLLRPRDLHVLEAKGGHEDAGLLAGIRVNQAATAAHREFSPLPPCRRSTTLAYRAAVILRC